SDEMSSTVTRPVAKSSLTDNPSSYGFSHKVSPKRVASRVVGEEIEDLESLLKSASIFESLNLLVDERESLLDFYLNDFKTSSRDDSRIADLEEILDQ